MVTFNYDLTGLPKHIRLKQWDLESKKFLVSINSATFEKPTFATMAHRLLQTLRKDFYNFN